MSELKNDLVALAALLEQGWCKGYMNRVRPDGTVQYCLVGGVRKVTDSPGIRLAIESWPSGSNVPSDNDRAIAASQALEQHTPHFTKPGFEDRHVSLWMFNDDYQTKKEDVLRLVQKAIEDLA